MISIFHKNHENPITNNKKELIKAKKSFHNNENDINLLNIPNEANRAKIQEKCVIFPNDKKASEIFMKRKSTIPTRNKFFNNNDSSNHLHSGFLYKENDENTITLPDSKVNKDTINKTKYLGLNEKESPLMSEANKDKLLEIIENNSQLELENFFRNKRNSLPIMETDYNLIKYYLNDPEIKNNKKVREFFQEYLNDEDEAVITNKENKYFIDNPGSNTQVANENDIDKFNYRNTILPNKQRSILKKSTFLKNKINASKIAFITESTYRFKEDIQKEKTISTDGKMRIKVSENEYITIDEKAYSYNIENILINKHNPANFSNEEYLRLYSHLIEKEFANGILENLLRESFSEHLSIKKFLSSHNISERVRSKMIDWIIEVLVNYNCDEQTFFIAVSLMDRYLKFYSITSLKADDIHLIGITCIFMASKYQDVYPLRLKEVKEKIAHNKFSLDQIKDKETQISFVLSFIITLPTQWDFINLFIEEIFYNSKQNNFGINNKTLKDNYLSEIHFTKSPSAKKVKFLNTEEISSQVLELEFMKYTTNFINLLKHLVLYLCKMNTHDYKISYKNPSLVAAATLFVSMKISEQINEETYISQYFCKKLIKLSNFEEQKIVKLAKRILSNAQNFENVFPNLNNLKKYHYEAITSLEFTK